MQTMLTVSRINPKPSDLPSNCTSDASDGPCENPLEDEDEGDTLTLNNVDSIKRGIIKTSKDGAKGPYTLLLVGETGVGKSSLLKLIANVLAGNDVDHYNFEILNHTNQPGSNNQSQINSARLYEFTSKNGVVLRILNTPGLADTRGVRQDELNRRRIATQIKDHIDTITAVLVLANGTMPHVAVGIEYALSTLSNGFPKSLASNIALIFTNVSTPLYWNFSEDSVPDILKNAPHFLLNNPIALQQKRRRLGYNQNMKIGRAGFRKKVEAEGENALGVLVNLVDWLDGLEPQPTTATDQAVAKEATYPVVVNQKRPSNHKDNGILVQRIGQFVTRSRDKTKEAWQRQWGGPEAKT